MFSQPYVKLGIATLLPVFISVFLTLIDRKTPFKKVNYIVKQAIFGILFGSLAIVGTEWGIPINGAQINCRDAAVLCGGLLFGGPAGIIAGLIGGIERYIAVAWGIGTYTRVACSVSTIVAGFYSAFLRKFMFDDKKPSWPLALATGVVMEIFHLTMVFLTNMSEPEKAISVVKACTLPMVIANAVSVMLAAVAVSALTKDKMQFRKENMSISQIVQRWLLVAIVLAFLATTSFVYNLQLTTSANETKRALFNAANEVTLDIRSASDSDLLAVTRKISNTVSSGNINEIARVNGVDEINLVDGNGIIYKSTEPSFVGFDFNSGEQSKEFLCVLGDAQQYVQKYGPISYNDSISRKYAAVKYGSGMVQVGYSGEKLRNDIHSVATDITRNRKIGETGYILMFDDEYNVVSAPNWVEVYLNIDDIKTFDFNNSDVFEHSFNDENCYCMCVDAEGYHLLAVFPEQEANRTRNIVLYVNTFMEILVFAVLYSIVYFIIKKVVVNQLKEVNKSLSQITFGDLNVVVNVRSNEEFALLSDDINTTVATLKIYIKEASARIDKELEFAKSIQVSALPSAFPSFPKRDDFDIYAQMNTAKEVGGDFYDFYLTNNKVVNFLIADVSGKGIPAAMFMMRAKTELKSLTEANMPIDQVFTFGNEALCDGNDAGMFVTAWQGMFDFETSTLKFVNAGHNPPLVKRGGGKFEYLKTPAGFVLAGMDGIMYKDHELNLSPGDTVFLYTDGVTEAINKDDELYGEDRLLHAINEVDFGSMKDLCEYIKDDVDRFVGEADQFDDITMVAFRYTGNKGEEKTDDEAVVETTTEEN